MKEFVAKKWFEILIVLVLGLVAWSMKEHWSTVQGTLGSLDESRLDHVSRLSTLEANTETLSRDVATATTEQRTFGQESREGFADVLQKLSDIESRLSALGAKVDRAEQDIRSLLQMRASRRLYVRPGKFSAATKISDSPPTFRWELRPPVDPATVIDVVAEPIVPPSPLEITAAITDGGSACVMTILGPEESINSLPESLDAKATIRLLD